MLFEISSGVGAPVLGDPSENFRKHSHKNGLFLAIYRFCAPIPERRREHAAPCCFAAGFRGKEPLKRLLKTFDDRPQLAETHLPISIPDFFALLGGVTQTTLLRDVVPG